MDPRRKVDTRPFAAFSLLARTSSLGVSSENVTGVFFVMRLVGRYTDDLAVYPYRPVFDFQFSRNHLARPVARGWGPLYRPPCLLYSLTMRPLRYAECTGLLRITRALILSYKAWFTIMVYTKKWLQISNFSCGKHWLSSAWQSLQVCHTQH